MLRLTMLLFALSAILASPVHAAIRIAVVAPLSGQFQVLGRQIRDGVTKAVADINAKGGIAGQTLVLDVEDDVCKAENAAAAANRIAGRGDVLVVGHVCAEAAAAAAEVYTQNGILLITPAITADSFTDRRAGPSIFRLAARDSAQGWVAGDYLARNYPGARMAVIDDGSPYARPIAEGVAAAIAKGGIRNVRRDSYDAGAKDYNDFAARLIDDATDVVFIGGYQGDIALILRALRTAKSAMTVMGPDTIATGQFLDLAGNDAQGTLFTFISDPRRLAAAAPVVATFRADGIEPVGLVLPAYAAVEAWLAARSVTGSDDMAAVASALEDNTAQTVLGPINFDANGSARLAGFSVYRWNNGAVVPAN